MLECLCRLIEVNVFRFVCVCKVWVLVSACCVLSDLAQSIDSERRLLAFNLPAAAVEEEEAGVEIRSAPSSSSSTSTSWTLLVVVAVVVVPPVDLTPASCCCCCSWLSLQLDGTCAARCSLWASEFVARRSIMYISSSWSSFSSISSTCFSAQVSKCIFFICTGMRDTHTHTHR